MNIIPFPLGAKSGIQRDGTVYDSNHFTSGQYTRFYHGWPQKMLGWSDVLRGNNEVIGNMFAVPRSQSYDIYVGRPSSLSYFNITNDGVVGPEIVVTPTGLFTPNNQNLWWFTSTTINPDTNPQTIIVAQVSHNLDDITNEDENPTSSPVEGPVFYGYKGSSAPFAPIIDQDGQFVVASGGVIATDQNILIVYGVQGIRWCVLSNGIDQWSPWQPFSSTKCCAAINYQGSLLLWSLDSMYRAQYIPPTPDSGGTFGSWAIQSISPGISIWSAKSILVYQNIVYWVGRGQFYTYNGSISNLYNNMNKNWFFYNINKKFKSKIATFVDEVNDEIWFLYPRAEKDQIPNTENSHAVMYYTRSQEWNDTVMPRSMGLSLSTYDHRLMPSTKLYNSVVGTTSYVRTYPLFQHEYGYDEVFNNISYPINAHITYPIKDFFSAQPSSENNICMQTFRIEPDFVLPPNTEMTVNLINQMYAQSTPVVSPPYTFDLNTEYIDIAPTQARLVSVQFTSNCLGGYFEGGKILHGIQKGAAAA